MFVSKLLVVFLLVLENVFCANILITDDLPTPSHQIWNYAIAEALVAKGHNVTMLGANTLKNLKTQNHSNYHHIILEDLFETIMGGGFVPEHLLEAGKLENLLMFYDYTILSCNHTYNTRGFKTLMNYPKDFKFDLILLDMTNCHCLLPFIQKFNYPPAVGLSAFMLPPYLSDMFGNDIQPSYLPAYFLRFSDDMSFIQRLQNFLLLRLDLLLRKTYLVNRLETMAIGAFGKNMNSLSNLERHVSLLLCNLNPVFHYPQPLTPNIVPVGGLHIKPNKTLPKDLQEIMDNAENGVILLSLGTNIRSDGLNVEKRKAFLNAFSKIKQTVLWKFESELTDLPKNVVIRKWLPQTEILAHPNIRLFISHGGGLSALEAAYFGVPVIGIPFFVDQHMNVRLAVNRGISIRLDYSSLSSENLLYAIEEILQNPSYTKNAKEMSMRVKDDLQTPLEKAIFWIEYAMRHNGTQFLTTRSRDISTFVSSCTDVRLFLLISLCLLVYILRKIFRLIKPAKDKHQKEKLN